MRHKGAGQWGEEEGARGASLEGNPAPDPFPSPPPSHSNYSVYTNPK